MKKRVKSTKRNNKSNLEHDIDDYKLPDDLKNSEDETASSIVEKTHSLYDYFFVKNNDNIIKSWSDMLRANDPKLQMESYQKLLGLILQISGYKIDITSNHIESDSYDIVLDEFRNKVEKMKHDPPLYKFLKDKSDVIFSFWSEISDALITTDVMKSETFKQFMEWILQFNSCKIRIIRYSSTIFICSLFEKLASALSWRESEIQRLKSESSTSSDHLETQISLFENEISFLYSTSNWIYQNLIIIRVRDVFEDIRDLAVQSLTKVIITYPTGFFDDQKLKYIGRALNDNSNINREHSLKSIESLVNFIKNSDDDQFSISLNEFLENYIPRIIEMCNDTNSDVVSAAIQCLGELINAKFVKKEDCLFIQKLLSDDSTQIKKSASEFVSKFYFLDNEENDNILSFVQFIQKFGLEKDLKNNIKFLYKNLNCLQNCQEMCDFLMTSENDEQSYLVTSLLLYSYENYINEDDSIKKDFTIIIIKSIVQLFKAYRSNYGIVLQLIKITLVFDLDIISDNSMDSIFEKVVKELSQLCSEKDYNVFYLAFESLNRFAQQQNQLSQIAQKEIDKFCVNLTITDMSNDIKSNLQRLSVVSKYVDISDNGKLKDQIVEYLNSIQKSTQPIQNEMVKWAIECLQNFFIWDVRNFHTYQNNDQKDSEKVEFIKSSLISEIQRLSQLFNFFISNDTIIFDVKIHSFQCLSNSMSILPIFLPEQINNSIDPLIISDFYQFYHKLNIQQKSEWFDHAARPIELKAIDASYSVHLLIYNHFTTHTQTTDLLMQKVKQLWKQISIYKPLNGSHLYEAFSMADLTNIDLKSISKFFISKVNCLPFLELFDRENDEKLIPVFCTFFVNLTKQEAKQIRPLIDQKYSVILDKIEMNIQISLKDVQKVISPHYQRNRSRIDHNNGEIVHENYQFDLSDDEIEQIDSESDDMLSEKKPKESEKVKNRKPLKYINYLETDDGSDNESTSNDMSDEELLSREQSENEFDEPDDTFLFRH